MPPPSPTNKFSQLSIQETVPFSQSTYNSTQPSQSQSQSKPNTQDTQYTEYTEHIEEATSHQRQQKSLPKRPSKWTRPVTPPPKGRQQSPDSAESSYLSSTPFSSPFVTPYKATGSSRPPPENNEDDSQHSPIVAAELLSSGSSLFSSSPQELRQQPTASTASLGKGGTKPKSPTATDPMYSSSYFSSPLPSPIERSTTPQLLAQQRTRAESSAHENSSQLFSQGESSYYSFSPLSSPFQSTQYDWATPGGAQSEKESPKLPPLPPVAAAAESSYLMSSPFPLVSTPPITPARRSGRLFRSKSGNLIGAAELRRRREAERNAEELLDMILEGFGGDGESVSKNTVTFCMDEVGRWRIQRPDPYEFEEYQNKK